LIFDFQLPVSGFGPCRYMQEFITLVADIFPFQLDKSAMVA